MPGKFNQKRVRPAAHGPLLTSSIPTGRTALGHPGYDRDEKTALFTLGVSNFVGEDAFHENAMSRDGRFRELVRGLAVTDPGWTAGFLGWLRTEGDLRSAPVLGAAEFVNARQVSGADPYGRSVINSVLQRGDEPAEAWAYWLANYGDKPPIAFQRGTADAVHRLYTERSLLRYDSPESALRFGDVIELSRPRYNHGTYSTWRDALYRYALMRRHGRDISLRKRADKAMMAHLPMILAARKIFALPQDQRRAFLVSPGGAQAIADAGIKWESVAGWLQGPMDAAAWEACIPAMGIFALARNLRNFDQAGVSDRAIQPVIAKFASQAEVDASRMFPFRWLAAYRHVPSLRWSYPLEQALNFSLSNVPVLPGRTLILTDRSLSMWGKKLTDKSDMDWADAGAIFAAALAARAANATLVEFSGKSQEVHFSRGESVLKIVERFGKGDGYGPLASGTDIPSAVFNHLRGHDRVIIITDEQTRAGYLPSNIGTARYGGRQTCEIDALIPKGTPVYMWNLEGYEYGALAVGPNRHLLAGLSDGGFRQLAALDQGRSTGWPWQNVPFPVTEQFAGVRTAKPKYRTAPGSKTATLG